MNSRFTTRIGIMLACGLAVFPAAAAVEILYKLIDRNGKITYSGEAPKNFDGQVIRLEIDPARNTATLPKYEPTPKAVTKEGQPGKLAEERNKLTREQRLEQARENLEKARRALADARDNPKDGDIQFIGKVGGGARPQPSEEYQKRLSDLEAAVKRAEEELQRVEQGG
jgi:hypothetical protein